jgi:hypothetical protein
MEDYFMISILLFFQKKSDIQMLNMAETDTHRQNKKDMKD